MRMKKFKSSSSTLEYAVLILIVVAALITMSGYVRRALSGRWREVGDTFGFGRQYGGISGKHYECTAAHIYSCVRPCGYNCSPERCFYLNNGSPAQCFSVSGSGQSNTSLQEACSLAVNKASQPNVSCGNKDVNWCAWFTTQTIWNEDYTKVLYKRTICPGAP